MASIATEIPAQNAPLPDRILLRHGWISGIAMTLLCVFLACSALWMLTEGRGVIAAGAFLASLPALWLGYQQLRSGGSYILLEIDGFTRGVYGDIDSWSWKDVSSFRADTYKGKTGVWCRQVDGETGDDIFIETGTRNANDMAELLNRFRQRAMGERLAL